VIVGRSHFILHRTFHLPGTVRYPITLIVALLGVIVGDNSLYFIGRGVGSNLLNYFGLKRAGTETQLDRMHAFMHRHGHLAIFYARFFPGFRALVYLSAGSFRIPASRFFFYDLAGAAISVPVVVTLAYVFGEQLEQVIRFISVFNKLIWVVASLCGLILLTRYLVLRYWYSGAKT
jgi:membrane protein DedA with SNARE-associated domain